MFNDTFKMTIIIKILTAIIIQNFIYSKFPSLNTLHTSFIPEGLAKTVIQFHVKCT